MGVIYFIYHRMKILYVIYLNLFLLVSCEKYLYDNNKTIIKHKL